MDDLQAVHRLKAGDLGGLESLVGKYQAKALRVAIFITNDFSIAEEIVQDTFVALAAHLSRFDDNRPFEPYLLRCVVNAALNFLRREKRSASFDGDLAGVETLLDQSPPVEAQIEFSQAKQEIQLALARLSPRQRAMIFQRYYLQMSEQEMAMQSGVAPGTVKWMLNAARSRLRRLLTAERSAE